MGHGLDSTQLSRLGGSDLPRRLLTELDRLFEEIEDGTVKENSFTGCIALEDRSLPALSEVQSRQVRELLLTEPVVDDRSEKSETGHHGIPVFGYLFDLIRHLWHSKDTDNHPAHPAWKQDNSHSMLLDPLGRVEEMEISSADGNRHDQAQKREINESDVKRFFNAHGEKHAWVLPYCWDIANRLSTVKTAEAEGDLALFLLKRRKLNVRRPKATPFEQSVQRYAAAISESYCDEEGNVTDAGSLEVFVHDLVIRLLSKTKEYWSTHPLLAIFDGVVATVIRPLLYKHRTSRIQRETTDGSGVVRSGSLTGQAIELITTPKWNDDALLLVEQLFQKAFKSQISFFLLDRFAHYNWEYARSPHPEAQYLVNAGMKAKEFGYPLHLQQVMELVKPTVQADELSQYVAQHFRSGDFLDH